MKNTAKDTVLQYNSAEPFCIGKWLRSIGNIFWQKDDDFKNVINANTDWDNVRVIQTNGHYWKLYEFGVNYLSKILFSIIA